MVWECQGSIREDDKCNWQSVCTENILPALTETKQITKAVTVPASEYEHHEQWGVWPGTPPCPVGASGSSQHCQAMRVCVLIIYESWPQQQRNLSSVCSYDGNNQADNVKIPFRGQTRVDHSHWLRLSQITASKTQYYTIYHNDRWLPCTEGI